jgi:hypothetical protein
VPKNYDISTLANDATKADNMVCAVPVMVPTGLPKPFLINLKNTLPPALTFCKNFNAV